MIPSPDRVQDDFDGVITQNGIGFVAFVRDSTQDNPQERTVDNSQTRLQPTERAGEIHRRDQVIVITFIDRMRMTHREMIKENEAHLARLNRPQPRPGMCDTSSKGRNKSSQNR